MLEASRDPEAANLGLAGCSLEMSAGSYILNLQGGTYITNLVDWSYRLDYMAGNVWLDYRLVGTVGNTGNLQPISHQLLLNPMGYTSTFHGLCSVFFGARVTVRLEEIREHSYQLEKVSLGML